MSTYDNLNIATVSLTFAGAVDPSISSRTFDLRTLSFLPNVPLIDQIEVERIFDTGYDTKFGANVFTIADRREMFILPKNWYSINEQTKILTIVDLSTIPTYTDNGLYYPESRTYVLETKDSNQNIQTIDIPNFLLNNVGTNINGVIRQPDTVIIRRKTLSLESIVTFAPGTRLTTTQLNLQFNQLKNLIQELIAKIKNESILKFDENAIDGPFLGGSDLKMSNNFIKDLNSKSVGEVNTQFTSNTDGNILYTGSTFAANIGTVFDALTQGTVRRTTMDGGTTVPFSGHFTASPIDGSGPLRITAMAAGVDNTDAATLGQVRDATNITTGTLTNAVLSNIPLSKLSNVSGQGYTLPVDALANSGATAGNYGVSTAGNTNNMVYMTVDAKGRITTIASRNMTVDDLPTSGVPASIYGNGTTPLVELTVDSKGRITGATERSITAADLTSINADNINSGTLNANRLATSGVTAGTTNIPSSITVDDKGRVTGISGGSIPAANVSGFDTQVRTNRLDQMTAPTASVSFNTQKITNLATPTNSTDGATKGYVDGYAAPLSTFNANVTSLIQSNAVSWDSVNSVFTANNGSNRRIANVQDPANPQDVVTRNYFEANALAASGGVISASTNPIINMPMRAPASIGENDVVNYGFIQNLVLTPGTTLIGSTTPQIYRDAWSGSNLSKTAGHLTGFDRYQRTFTDLGAVNSFMILLEADSVTKTFVPYSAAAVGGTVHDGYFWLDTSGANKVLNIWLTTGTTPSGNLVTRNFGLSRLVSGALATGNSTGLVAILSGNDGGIAVDGNGYISLKQATTSQIGGIKQGTGLTITSGVAAVNLTDSTSTTNSNTAASATAVKAAYDKAATVETNLATTNSTVSSLSSTLTTTTATANAALARAGGTMTGKLITATPSSSTASIVLPSGSAPNAPVSGDIWNNAGTLQFYNGSAPKTLAFTDSSITGNAATATTWATGRTITLTGAVSGISGSFNGSANLSFSTTLSSTAAVTSLQGTANQVLVNGTSGTSTTGAITLTLPQSIDTAATPTFGSVTAKNLTLGYTNNTIISTNTDGNINLDPNGNGIVNVQSPLDVDGTLNVDGATTLVGNVTINSPSTLTLLNSEGKISLGAASSTTSINRQVSTSSPATAGDLVLRVPASGKAWLVANNSTTTSPASTDEVIVKSSLDVILSNYVTSGSVGTFMATSGTLVTGSTNQVLGTDAGANGSFIVKTANVDRLSINSSGDTTIHSNLSVAGLTACTGQVNVTDLTEYTDASTTLTTKSYVDSYHEKYDVIKSYSKSNPVFFPYDSYFSNIEYYSTPIYRPYLITNFTFSKRSSNKFTFIRFTPIKTTFSASGVVNGTNIRLIAEVVLETPSNGDITYNIPLMSTVAINTSFSTQNIFIDCVPLSFVLLNKGTYNHDTTLQGPQSFNTTNKTGAPGDLTTANYNIIGDFKLKNLGFFAWIDASYSGTQRVQLLYEQHSLNLLSSYIEIREA